MTSSSTISSSSSESLCAAAAEKESYGCMTSELLLLVRIACEAVGVVFFVLPSRLSPLDEKKFVAKLS